MVQITLEAGNSGSFVISKTNECRINDLLIRIEEFEFVAVDYEVVHGLVAIDPVIPLAEEAVAINAPPSRIAIFIREAKPAMHLAAGPILDRAGSAVDLTIQERRTGHCCF